MAAAGRGSKEGKRTGTICEVLQHPLRVRILEVLDEGPRSPSQFVQEGLFPADFFRNYQQALSLASYHFRALEEEGCVEVIESIPRRGAVEHVYRGKSRIYLTDEEFDEMAPAQRAQLSQISAQSLIARIDTALQTKRFDTRTDRHFTWSQMQLDERGWQEAMTALAGCFGEIEQIRHDAADRLAASGEEAITTTVAMLGFESPPPPPLPLPSRDSSQVRSAG
jgi:DNA-binding transcriptional ArsR family regulator